MNIPAHRREARSSVCQFAPNNRCMNAASHTNSKCRKSWLITMISDSALPVGGFVASSGLESSLQQNQCPSVEKWISESLFSLHFQSCPFIIKLFQIPCSSVEELICKIKNLDQEYHVSVVRSYCLL
jgi:hypothetical protein